MRPRSSFDFDGCSCASSTGGFRIGRCIRVVRIICCAVASLLLLLFSALPRDHKSSLVELSVLRYLSFILVYLNRYSRKSIHYSHQLLKMSKPILLHLGDDVRWDHAQYSKLQDQFTIMRSYSMNREEFKTALEHGRFGDFVAIYRPFWNTGGEMGTWNDELM
jgi:hypothetical protein